MKKFLPLIFMFTSLLVIYLNVFQKENILTQGETIYIGLEPTDPRSLLQGSYMQLRYQLHLQDTQNMPVNNPQYLILKIVINKQKILNQSFINYEPKLRANERLLRVKYKKTYLYPTTESFLFAESLEQCYIKAKFAQFKVDKHGNALLNDLLDKNLQSLNCEVQARD